MSSKLNTLKLYEKMTKLPFGHKIFSEMLCKKAPYFSSISPVLSELRPGLAKAKIKNRRKVQNHLGTVHAIAMCNLAELVGGLMTDVSIPSSMRWIPVGMEVEYLKKAKTDLEATALGDKVNWENQSASEISVPVEVRDRDDDLVFRARIKMKVSPKDKK